jgi:steroid delta-isomerase-like uncharacterized protein
MNPFRLLARIALGLAFVLHDPLPVLASTQSEERNRKLFEEYLAAENAADFQGMARLFSSEFRSEVNGKPVDGVGPSVEIDTVRPLRDAFPDYVASVEQLITHEDQIVARWKIAGTHTARLEILPLPPTNKPVEIAGCTVLEVVGGKITRGFNYVDQSALMGQLGVLGLLAMGAFIFGGAAAGVLGFAGVALRRKLIAERGSSTARRGLTLVVAVLIVGVFTAVAVALRTAVNTAL